MKKIIIAFCALTLLACTSFTQAEDSARFAGMAKVKVVSVDKEDGDLNIFVRFLAVDQVWTGDATPYIGKKFFLIPAKTRMTEKVKIFLGKLSVGDEVIIDVGTIGEKVLEFLELTDEQQKSL